MTQKTMKQKGKKMRETLSRAIAGSFLKSNIGEAFPVELFSSTDFLSKSLNPLAALELSSIVCNETGHSTVYAAVKVSLPQWPTR